MSTKPTSIRIDPATDAKLDDASRLSGLPKADIMRWALSVGLKDLELINYDVTAAIHAHVAAAKQSPPDVIGKHESPIAFRDSGADGKANVRSRQLIKPNLKNGRRD